VAWPLSAVPQDWSRFQRPTLFRNRRRCNRDLETAGSRSNGKHRQSRVQRCSSAASRRPRSASQPPHSAQVRGNSWQNSTNMLYSSVVGRTPEASMIARRAVHSPLFRQSRLLRHKHYTHVSCLESALTEVLKIQDFKSSSIRSYEKKGGRRSATDLDFTPLPA